MRRSNPEIERLKRELTLNQIALQCVKTEKPEAVERVRERSAGRYTLALYRAENGDGGILVREFRHRGQRPSVSAHWFEEQWRERGRWPVEFQVVLGRLAAARQRAWDRERHARLMGVPEERTGTEVVR